MASVAKAPTKAPGRLDRIATLLAPEVGALGSPGTIAFPLVIVVVISLVSAAATWTWVSAAPPGSGAEVLRKSGYLVWLLAVAAPLAATVKGLLFTALAWGLLVLMGGEPRVRALVSTLFYGEAILSTQALWVTGATLFLALPAPSRPGVMPVASGLDALVSESGALLAVAQQVTPFHVAWVVFLTLAFAAHGGLSRWRGLGAALLLWGVSTGLAVLRTSSL